LSRFGCDLAEREQELDICLDHVLIQALIWDEVQHAAQFLACLENIYGIAHLCQGSRCSEAGRPAADDSDLLAVLNWPEKLGMPPMLFGHFDNSCLNSRNIDRPVEFLMSTGCHAQRIRTDQTADTAERVVAHNLSSSASYI
jgi:hypothetical protein